MSEPREILRDAFRTGSTDRAAASAGVHRLYAALGERSPRIVWTPSPLRLLLKVIEGDGWFFFFKRGNLIRLPNTNPVDAQERRTFCSNAKMIREEFYNDYCPPSWLTDGSIESMISAPILHEMDAGERASEVAEINRHTPFWIPYKRVCLLCDRPTKVRLDPRLNLQSTGGKPAIEYRDGWHLFADHRERVPSFNLPEKIDYGSMMAILAEKLPDHRKVALAIDIYGRDVFVRQFCVLQNTDRYGHLYHTGFMPWNNLDEIKFLKVLNSTRNLDGIREAHYLRVPPGLNSPLEAVAWTFNVGPNEYARSLAGES